MALSSLPVFYITSSFLKKNLSKKFLKQILFIILNNLSLYIYSFGSFCSSLSPKSKKGGGRKKKELSLRKKGMFSRAYQCQRRKGKKMSGLF
jgi:hypothetical protein